MVRAIPIGANPTFIRTTKTRGSSRRQAEKPDLRSLPWGRRMDCWQANSGRLESLTDAEPSLLRAPLQCHHVGIAARHLMACSAAEGGQRKTGDAAPRGSSELCWPPPS